MAQTMSLHKLHFGSDDAELDEKRGFLDKVFLKTSIYHRVKETNRELVIGRKGSGKSAICLMVRKALYEEGHSVIMITPQSLSRQKLEKLRVDSINQNESYILGWKYVLLVKLSLELINTTVNTNSKAYKWVRKFLRDNNEIDKTALDKVTRLLDVSELKLSAFGVEGSMKSSATTQQQKDLADGIEKFQEQISTILSVARETNFFILIDRVDDIWQQNEQSENMVIGLIKAIHDLNISLHHCHFILFLREDIYDNLIFNDSDKFHSLEERLVWEENDLKHLIATRGKVSANIDAASVDGLWNKIFESGVRNEPSFQYIVKKTLKRPRDIIQFCNNALSEAQNNGHNQILAQDILKAEGQYSAWKLKDIVSEFIVQYPYLEELLGLFQGFQVEFSRSDFEKRYSDTLERLKHRADLQTVSANKMLQILYSIGFLGAKTDQGPVFTFDDPGVALAQQQRIVIHPAFHSALSVQVESTSTGSIFDQRGQVVGNQYNVAGDVRVGANVGTIFYESKENIQDEITHVLELIRLHKRNRELLELQLAQTGGHAFATPHLINQLEDVNTNIAELDSRVQLLQQRLDK